jgi:nitrite reductase (NADH) large subunit
MAGARMVEDLLALDRDRFHITMFGDEPYGNYNRILLSNVLNGSQDMKEIFLNPLSWYEENDVTLHAGHRVTSIDRQNRTVHAGKLAVPYDKLILATGSKPFVPPMQGIDKEGVFVFRTLDDCRKIADHARGCKRAIVIGGGLLGLEAAKGLMTHNLGVTVVEVAPYLMSVQLDTEGGAILRRTIEKMGIHVRTGTVTTHILGEGRVSGVRFADDTKLPADMVVISAGIRANLELAREAGLPCDRGILVDDQLGTTDPDVYAVGECAQHRGMVYGLVAPLWEQTKVLAAVLTDTNSDKRYEGSRLATKLKVMGVELASMGKVSDVRDGDEVVHYAEPGRGVYKKIVIREGKIAAACVLGEHEGADELLRLYQADAPPPERRADLLFPPCGEVKAISLADLPETHQVCDCNGVSKTTICDAIRAGKCTVAAVGAATRAGTGCGSCKTLVKGLIEAVAGDVKADPSEGWYVPAVPMDKPALVAEIRKRGLKSVSAVLCELGTGEDMKSKNGLASLLKSLWNDEYIDERDARFVNDRVHANIQKDGTFSVVPRIYGGVTSPEELIRIGEVAKKYKVPMVKVTGGQRIDLLGVPKEQLPSIWRDLGMPSGYAYTKAFRTCKTCVGTDFCRYGTNDSTGLGIAIEKRFQGIEFPAKVKMAVSGCPRNCAEATVKDIGVVATEGGEWEVGIGGAAGASVRKYDVLCRVKTKDEALTIIGRFMQYYRENAKWLERTYDFVPRIGLEKLKDILLNDSLGICERLDCDIQASIDAYVDPWAAESNKPAYAGQFDVERMISLPVLA